MCKGLLKFVNEVWACHILVPAQLTHIYFFQNAMKNAFLKSNLFRPHPRGMAMERQVKCCLVWSASKGSWHELSVDFKEGLASSHHNVTLVVVWLNMPISCPWNNHYAHFLALKHPFTTANVASFFSKHSKFQPVCDRDMVFLGVFWQEWFKTQCT
jgi:hypothetical protein